MTPSDRLDAIKVATDEGLACLLGEEDVAWLVAEVERLRQTNHDDPAFREALATALHEVDFETNPELKYITSSHDIDLYREQADRVLRKLRRGDPS
jgi:hypothetical protein